MDDDEEEEGGGGATEEIIDVGSVSDEVDGPTSAVVVDEVGAGGTACGVSDMP